MDSSLGRSHVTALHVTPASSRTQRRRKKADLKHALETAIVVVSTLITGICAGIYLFSRLPR